MQRALRRSVLFGDLMSLPPFLRRRRARLAASPASATVVAAATADVVAADVVAAVVVAAVVDVAVAAVAPTDASDAALGVDAAPVALTAVRELQRSTERSATSNM